MKQNDLAKKLGVTQAYISAFINGKRGCSLLTAKKLSSIFGNPPLWWMESTPEQRQCALGREKGSKPVEIKTEFCEQVNYSCCE